jgi:hypothetical protein
MSHRRQFPPKSPILPIALAILLLSLLHCQKKDETPPPPKAQAPAAASAVAPVSTCCQFTPAPGMKEGSGRLVVAFPETADTKASRVAVLNEGREMESGHGSRSWELSAGTYEVNVSGRTVPNVAVLAGQETHVKVGVLHVNATGNTLVELVDPSGKIFASGYGAQSYGLPVGAVRVQVAGQSETVTIEDGKVAEF